MQPVYAPRNLLGSLAVVNNWFGDFCETIAMEQHTRRAGADLDSDRGILHSVIFKDNIFDQRSAISRGQQAQARM
jgi:hypothetical protein